MTVRIGVLGCARIAPAALVRPARKVDGVEVTAVASRSYERARKWAVRHGIPRALGGYGDLVADPNVDAVYIPLPNSLHAEWSTAALRAGKHVLCEKPLAASEQEAATLAAESAAAPGLVAMEAFHYRYHPLARRVAAIIRSGELGELRTIEAELLVPILLPRDIRWYPELAGGAAMDVGGYVVNMARFLAGSEPQVLTASGSLTRRGVDRSFEARMSFGRGVEAVVRGSLLSAPRARARVVGTKGFVSVWNPIMPQLGYRLKVSVMGAERRERVGGRSTYVHQLEAFVAAIRDGGRVETDFADAVHTMRVLDRIRSLVGVRGAAGPPSAQRWTA